jgi:hypothetical protein
MADDAGFDSKNADTVGILEPPRYEGLNIHQRLNRARAETKKIEKTKKKDGMKYDFIGHDDVTAHVKPIFLRWGISPWHTVIEHRQDSNRIELTVQSTFFCEDEPTDQITMETVGYGIDNQDKGPGKALTYAVRGATTCGTISETRRLKPKPSWKPNDPHRATGRPLTARQGIS